MEQKLKSMRGSNQKIRTGPFRLLNLNTLNEAKNILESYYEEKTRGVIIRARHDGTSMAREAQNIF